MKRLLVLRGIPGVSTEKMQPCSVPWALVVWYIMVDAMAHLTANNHGVPQEPS